ncbi:MAG: glycosyltransferase family 1 protein [Planctomycetota bacterium]|nr:MAG: glycosyltransferase family 1 protein [Planctomycetota bacterium]
MHAANRTVVPWTSECTSGQTAAPPRRLLIWSDGFPPDVNGVSVFVAGLVESLVARGFEIGVITNNDAAAGLAETEFAGATVWQFPFCRALADLNLGAIQQMLPQVADIKRRFAPDLIHLHSLRPSLMFHLRTAEAARVPTLFSLHLMPSEAMAGRDSVIGAGLRSADGLTTNSRAVKRGLVRQFPELEERAAVVPLGLRDMDAVAAPLPWDPPRLLAFGRLVEDKGFDLILAALPAIRRQIPDANLIIAGDGPEREPLERLVAQQQLQDAVEFTGWVDREALSSLINRATAVVVPSRCEEALGLVAIEAAIMERPVIASATGGLVEVVQPGQTGELFTRDDPHDLAAKAIALLSNRSVAATWGRQARRLVQTEFSWERSIDAFIAAYIDTVISHAAAKSQRADASGRAAAS